MEAQQAGTVMHTQLAYHYQSRACEAGRPAPRWFNTPVDVAVERDAAGDPTLVPWSKELLRNYLLKWRVDPIEPIFIEEEFAVELGELDSPTAPIIPASYRHEIVSCRSDFVGKMNGVGMVMDHKTQAGDYRTQRLAKWRDDNEFSRSAQVLMNLRILRAHPRVIAEGLTVEHFIVNRIKRQSPWDFDRQPVIISSIAYQDFVHMICDAIDAERRATDCANSGQPIPPNFSSCSGKYGPNSNCPYEPVCWASNAENQERAVDALFKIGKR
jgi:hypothetical protein